MKEISNSRKTIRMCFYKASTGELCSEEAQWKLKPTSGLAFKVCDLHLPWGLRYSGCPAFVDEFKTSEETTRIISEKILKK